MRKYIFVFAFLMPLLSWGQLTTANPDTVCYQETGSIYEVVNNPGETYTWTIAAPGILVSGQGTNSIIVDWSNAAPGTIANGVSVYPTNQWGCEGPPVNLNVFVLNIVPTVTPASYCEDEPCDVLIGTPMGGLWSGPGVVGNTFCPSQVGPGTYQITYTYTQAGCTTFATGDMVVYPLPVISPIYHD